MKNADVITLLVYQCESPCIPVTGNQHLIKRIISDQTFKNVAVRETISRMVKK
jgi:hypothetical protein